jgi:hypothetical protein
MKFCFGLAIFLLTLSSYSENVEVDLSSAKIVLPPRADKIKRFAAEELQYHLQLVTDKKLPIVSNSPQSGYCFYVGIPDPSDDKKLKKEEARWTVGPQAAYIWGDDKDNNRYEDDFKNFSISVNGTLYAVYDFLNKVLKIRHLEPGIDGIAFEKKKTLPLPAGKGNWRSPFEFRGIRNGLNWAYYQKTLEPKICPEFKISEEDFNQRLYETKLWLLRMRQGKRELIPYGHAFTHWWAMYHKTHPEYFALFNGKRAPVYNRPTWIKLCLSNPAVTDRIFQNWLAAYKKAPQNSKIINLCLNDGGCYCECAKCKALGPMSDRLAYLTNVILNKATKIDPEVRCTIYAYGDYVVAPRKVKVHSHTIVGFVPVFLNLEVVENNYKGWYNMGAQALFLRPNTFHINIGLPMGYEKEVFKSFQLGVKYGVIGTDYDSLQNFWSANGIAPYILSRAFIDPSKSFDYWEDEYCSAYGDAAKIVKEYFQYIRRTIWEGRSLQDKRVTNYNGVLRRNIVPRMKELFKISDYVNAGKILEKAKKLKLTPQQTKRLDTLILENRHALLTVRAILAKDTEKLQRGRELLEFRIKHKNDLNIYWPSLLNIEQSWDIVGLKGINRLKKYSYAEETPDKWYFEVDNNALGSKQNWQNLDFARIRNTWIEVPVYLNWEKFGSQVPAQLAKILTDYNGIGWYAQDLKITPALKGKKIYLYFEAVDESCWVYVNGKLAGKHLFVKADDWKTPFAIRIDGLINWQKARQTVIVKVEDKTGNGGIYKPVWITAE